MWLVDVCIYVRIQSEKLIKAKYEGVYIKTGQLYRCIQLTITNVCMYLLNMNTFFVTYASLIILKRDRFIC